MTCTIQQIYEALRFVGAPITTHDIIMMIMPEMLATQENHTYAISKVSTRCMKLVRQGYAVRVSPGCWVAK